MFERYTEKARRVIFFARYEACQFGSSAIDTEHLFLGLLREDLDVVNRFLPRGKASIKEIRNRIGRAIDHSENASVSVDLPLSTRAKDVLKQAAEESMMLQDRHIGTEHLLLGLLHEDKGISYEILHELGLNVDLVRDRLMQEVSDTPIIAENDPRDRIKSQISEMRRLARAMMEKCNRIEEDLNRFLSEDGEADSG